jgi:hypothetical protein
LAANADVEDETRNERIPIKNVVMAGLDPAIHVFGLW